MTDDQVLAKVRAAAEKFIDDGYSDEDGIVARAALAMVELRKTLADGAQCQRRHAADCDKQHDDEGARLCRVSAMEYEWVVARIDDALRTAVASE